MVRPNMQSKTEEGNAAPYIPSGVAPHSVYPEMDKMFADDDEGSDPESTGTTDPKDQDPQDDGDDFDHQYQGDDNNDPDDSLYSFDSGNRLPGNAAAEALRRSRQTQADVANLDSKLDKVLAAIQTGGGTAATGSMDNGAVAYSPEDEAAINEAMKTNPAQTMAILQRDADKRAQAAAERTISGRMEIESAKRDAEQTVVGMYSQMRNPTHPFRKAVSARLNQMKSEYSQRGINPDTVPDLIRHAAYDVAINQPELIGTSNQKTRIREDSRQRNADRVTQSTRTRSGGTKKDALPELSDKDIQRGRKLGIDMNDPKIRKSLQMRRRHYEGRRR